MGVLACDRQDCNNIMCDYLSPTYGYLCCNCILELKATGGHVTIAEFMLTSPAEDFEKDDWDYFVDEEFTNT